MRRGPPPPSRSIGGNRDAPSDWRSGGAKDIRRGDDGPRRDDRREERRGEERRGEERRDDRRGPVAPTPREKRKLQIVCV